MEKYGIILKNNSNEGPKAFGIENIEGPRVPTKGEIISTDSIAGYIMTYANKENNLGYISSFSHSNFVVDNVTHAPISIGKGKLEITILVEATKIKKKK